MRQPNSGPVLQTYPVLITSGTTILGDGSEIVTITDIAVAKGQNMIVNYDGAPPTPACIPYAFSPLDNEILVIVRNTDPGDVTLTSDCNLKLVVLPPD